MDDKGLYTFNRLTILVTFLLFNVLYFFTFSIIISIFFSVAAIIGGAVVVLLCAILFVMFIVYRMRKKDEGSYALDEPKKMPNYSYQRAPDKEFYA